MKIVGPFVREAQERWEAEAPARAAAEAARRRDEAVVDEARRRAADEQRRADLLEQLETAGAPREAWPWIVTEAPAPTSALRAVRALDDQHKALLVLSGPKDSGKTGAAAWWVAQAPGGLFVHAELLLETWLAPGGRRRLVTATRLVVDDSGQEGGSPEQLDIMRQAIDGAVKVRCADLRPTVICTNYRTVQDFGCYLGAGTDRDRWHRLQERLIEHGVVGGRTPGWASCPEEGLRDPARRARVLAAREVHGGR